MIMFKLEKHQFNQKLRFLINHLKIIFLWRTLTLCSRITKLTQKEISQYLAADTFGLIFKIEFFLDSLKIAAVIPFHKNDSQPF